MTDDNTTQAPPVQIDFGFADAVPVEADPLPAAPVSTGLERMAVSESHRQGLVCSKLLVGASLAQARQQAEALYPKMLANQVEMMKYGDEALKALNGLVDRLLKEVEPIRIPQLNAMLGGLNQQMLAIKGKYDINDPHFKSEYSDFINGVKKRFRKARDFVALMKADMVSVEKQLDSLGANLTGRQYDMTRNVVYYNQLYAENEKAITNLIYVIGVMELIVEIARQKASEIQVGDASLGDRGGERRQEHADLISALEVKITDYKGRLWIAWATSPQTRMMRGLDVGMANKLNQLVSVTIPQMKLVLVQWRMMLGTFEASQVTQAVIDMSNQWTQEYFKQGAEVMPKIADVINQPTVWPETMNAIADSLGQAAEGILNAYKAGDQRRAEIDQAMMSTSKALGDVNRKIDETIIGQIVGSATRPAPIEITTSVPRAIGPSDAVPRS